MKTNVEARLELKFTNTGRGKINNLFKISQELTIRLHCQTVLYKDDYLEWEMFVF